MKYPISRTAKIATAVALASVAAVTAGTAAYAAKETENDAMAIMGAKVSLQQAVASAESHAGGKAARAEYEKNKAGKWVFDVEVVKTGAVMDVTVDGNTGAVLTSVLDKADKDDEHDKPD